MKGLNSIKKYIEEELSLLENQPKPQTELQIGHDDGRTIALYNVLELVNHKIDTADHIVDTTDMVEEEHELGEEETPEQREVRAQYEDHLYDCAKERNLK